MNITTTVKVIYYTSFGEVHHCKTHVQHFLGRNWHLPSHLFMLLPTRYFLIGESGEAKKNYEKCCSTHAPF